MSFEFFTDYREQELKLDNSIWLSKDKSTLEFDAFKFSIPLTVIILRQLV